VANRTDATFIRVIGSELVQKYVGEGARMVRELFEMARTKKACIIFFDEIDAVGGKFAWSRTRCRLMAFAKAHGMIRTRAATTKCSGPCWSSSTS
jgi:AAA+ superfamily predicted ATPase